MWRATVKGVLARKVRLVLTALAVVLGVMFVSGTYVLTDTLKHSFGTLFSQYAAGVDLVVRTHAPYSGEDTNSRQRLPEGIVDVVRRVPGVDAADGFLQGYAQFVGKDGKTTIQTAGAPTFGISWSGGDQVGPARIAEGKRPVRDGEVAMDVGTAGRNGFKVGDRVKVLLEGEAEEFKLVGLFKLGTEGDFGAVSFAAFDPHTAQRVFGAPGVYDAINVRVAPGTSVATAKRALEHELNPAGTKFGGFEVSSAAAVANETGKPVDELLGSLNEALLGFAGVGLLVGGFIIFNTFTILVSQRTRELGLLRAMGASGTQVVGSVLTEAVVVGLFASAVGLLLGVALAAVLLWALPGLGFPVPSTDLVVIGRTVFAAGLVGVGVTMLAAVLPAIRAARTAPIAAITDVRESLDRESRRGRAVGGVLVTVIGVAIGVYGFSADLPINNAVTITFVGGFVIFLGLVVFGPLIARPLSSAIGRPLRFGLGMTGNLARGNAMRNPRRTFATAAALIVGLALVTLVAIFADSVKTSVRGALNDVRADYILTAPQFAGFSPEVATRVAKLPGVEAAVGFRWGDVRIENHDETVNGANVGRLNDVLDMKYVAGNAAGVEHGGILISEAQAKKYGKRVGDPLTVVFPASATLGAQRLRISGIYTTRRFTGAFPIDFIVSSELFAQSFAGNQQDTLIYVKAKPGQAAAVGRRMSKDLAEPFPNIKVESRSQYLDTRIKTVDQFLNVFFALLLLSEIIAVLGIVNTLMLSIYERTREIGLLRTVGTTRRQIWSMVCGESVIIAAIGCVLGLSVGVLWGWGVTKAAQGEFVDTFSIPGGQLVLFLVASVIAGVVASVLPAWRASRLDVLEAIAHE